MRAITPVFSVLLIVVLSVALVSFLWLFFTGTFNSLKSSGTSTVGESLTTISSCMKIESVYGNQVSIRNCGKGVVSGDSLKVYLDDIPVNVTPLISDFGKKNIGASENGIGSSSGQGTMATRFQAPLTGTITSVYVYTKNVYTGADKLVYLGVYSDNSGAVGSLLQSKVTDINIPNDNQYHDWYKSSGFSVPIVAGSYYWLSESVTNGGWFGVLYDNGVTNQAVMSNDYGPPSTTLTNPTYYPRQYSIYATISPSISQDGTGEFTFSGLWNFNPGRYTLRVTNPRVTAEIPVDAVLPDSAVLDLEFDEGSGIVAYDSSAYGNNGMLGDGTCSPGSDTCPNWVDGKFGKALKFDAIDDFVRVLSSDSINNVNNTNQVTVEGWIKLDSLNWGLHTIAQKGTSEHYGFFLGNDLRSGSPHSIWWQIGNSSLNAWLNCDPNFEFFKDRWYHVMSTYDGSEMKVFIDGEFKNWDSSCHLNRKIIMDNANLFIGEEGIYGANNLNGTIDSVRVYDKALTPDQTISLKSVSYD